MCPRVFERSDKSDNMRLGTVHFLRERGAGGIWGGEGHAKKNGSRGGGGASQKKRGKGGGARETF